MGLVTLVRLVVVGGRLEEDHHLDQLGRSEYFKDIEFNLKIVF